MIDKEKQFSRQNEFIKNSYDRINLTVPKGYKEKIKKRAESERKSINAWLKDLIDEKINDIS